jgi:hypothetical protein
MRRLYVILFCLLSVPVSAKHIVGGEIELHYISGNTYRVNLIYYFDVQNNPGRIPEQEEPTIDIGLFRKFDNVRLSLITLSFSSKTRVGYTQPDCSKGEIVTDKLIYTTTIELPADQFGHPKGYYLSWERCCRNYNTAGLLNIVSEQPPTGVVDDPNAAGQTFYLEFPAVVKNGKPFINSTPRLFPPLNDYACPNKPYYADFAGVDDDGDSLVYSLVTPLNTFNAEAVPQNGPRPGPYPPVRWRDPFSLEHIMRGNPDLSISTDGLLTVTPKFVGLFVFAVRCEEFRFGEKIGEVRRDFQMLVVDRCSAAVPPQITGRKLGEPNFTYDNTMNVSFTTATPDASRCIEVKVSDMDIWRPEDGYLENITIRAVPIGFKKDVSGILPAVTQATLNRTDSIKIFRICFDHCPYLNGPFTIGIIASDDACSLPLTDTLKVTVDITPPPNNTAKFITPNVTETLTEGTIKSWTIQGKDLDGDGMVLGVIPQGFNLADYGFKYTEIKNINGVYEGRLDWDTRCDVYDFTHQTQFIIKFLLDDIDECNLFVPDTRTFNLTVVLPANANPVIDTDLVPGNTEEIVYLSKKINETLSFHVFGTDADNDSVRLTLTGADFSPGAYGASFPTAKGKGQVSSLFTWTLTCDKINLNRKDQFIFHFTAIDDVNKCRFYNTDTVDVVVTVLPPDNLAPDLEVTSLNPDLPLVNNTMHVTLGQQIGLGLHATDKDTKPQADLLKITMIEAKGNVDPDGYVFADGEGRGSAETTFTWNPQCNIFKNGIYENQYTFTFRVYDDRCFNIKADTVSIDITIKDVENDPNEFLPPNFISPNGDGLNDFFAMVRLDESTGELVNILPKDNCVGKFEGITIFNRWGREVYTSRQRDFKWYAKSESAGHYFYVVKYSNRDYKGIITVSYFDSQSNR